VPKPEKPKRGKAATAGTPPDEVKLCEIPLRMLADRLHESRQGARSLGGEGADKAQAQVERIEAACKRRGYVIPETPDTPPMTGRARRGRGH
jgi:hypothetical protein